MKWIFLATLIRTGQSEPDPEITEKVESFLTSDQSGHTNNWAVLVCASRYWFNYRHVANTLAVYRSVKKLGIPGRSKFSNVALNIFTFQILRFYFSWQMIWRVMAVTVHLVPFITIEIKFLIYTAGMLKWTFAGKK